MHVCVQARMSLDMKRKPRSKRSHGLPCLLTGKADQQLMNLIPNKT